MNLFINIRYSERNRLLLALGVILLVAFVGTSLINYSLTRAAIHQEIVQKDLPLTRDNVYSDLTSELMRPILVASSMAADTFLKDWTIDGEQDPEKVIKYLGELRDRYGFFTTFFISASTNKYYHFKGVHKIISPDDEHDVWYYALLASDKEYVLDVDTDQASQNILTVFINYKVFDRNGQLLGVAGVGLQVDALADLIKKYQQKYDRSIYLTDTKGLIQVHQDKNLIEKKSIGQMEGLASYAEQILRTRGESSANFQFESDGHDIILTVRHIKAIDWLLFVEQSETEALSQARMNLARTVLIGFLASIFIIFLTLVTINRYQGKVEEMATRDALTGVGNRRVLEHEFKRVFYLNSRSPQIFSILLLDLDGFKRVNDSLGHLAGDSVLKLVAGILQDAVRPTDIVARWGGDEFVVLTTISAVEASKIAERIRQYLADGDLAGDDTCGENDPRNQITMSCGITEFKEGDTLDSMLNRADKAMYSCKRDGGDRVLVQYDQFL